MTVISARHLNRIERRKMWMTCRRVAAIIGLCVVISQTTLADSIRVTQVVQTLHPTRGLADLRVNDLAQDPVTSDAKGKGGNRSDQTKTSDDVNTRPSLLGVEVDPQPQQIGVEVVGDAIVEGTVCDCGEILVPGGLPKWPLIFLATIPLIFIHDCDDCVTTCLTCDTIVTPTPSPTPPNNTVPEPATLLLFGTGLLAFGAGFRRRYSKSKVTPEIQTEDE